MAGARIDNDSMRIASSVAIFAAVFCLAYGAVAAGAVAFGSGHPESVGDRMELAAMMMVVWSPIALVALWKVVIPVVLVGGLLLAYLRMRFQLDARIAASRIGTTIAVVVFAGALFVAMFWLIV